VPSPQEETWARVRPILLTTLVPVVAALGIFVLAVYGKTSANVLDQPSMAAFDACLSANNLQPAQSYPSQFDQTIAAQQEMQVCGSKIPPAVIAGWQKQADAAQASFQNCINALGGSSRGGSFGGRFGGGDRDGSSGFRGAYNSCQALLQGSGGSGGTSPIPKLHAPAPGPVA
jgi:hypothetical protein